MHYDVVGNKNGPVMIAVPGLLGGPEDFRGIVAGLEDQMCFVILDPNRERREKGLSSLTAEVMQEVSYNSTSEDIVRILTEIKREKVYLMGISIGGKIVYDFAIKYPQHFLGGIVTDVGPGSFADSELYCFVDSIVQETNMELSWIEMKEDLKKRIPDRSMRSLIQTQIYYPDQKPPGQWKTAMRNFRKMMQKQSIDEQFDDLLKKDEVLARQNSIIHVFQAKVCSGIDEKSLPILKSMESIQIHPITEASHFLHITHKNLIRECLLKMMV